MRNDRLYPLSHAPISFYFRQTPADFVVTEIPLYPFGGEGEHLILKVRKKGLSTWEMIGIFASSLGIKSKTIGYAGLKDKNAMTIQYISLPAACEKRLAKFSHPQIKILETTRHRNKLRIGHLKGNRFFVRLKKVGPTDAKKIDEILKWIARNGMPNYFGWQRFGRDGENYLLAKRIVEGQAKMADKKRRDFLISAYQSHLFNLWLSKRIEISRLFEGLNRSELQKVFAWGSGVVKAVADTPHFFKLLPGDLAEHYPKGRLFTVDSPAGEGERFVSGQIAPTGPLCGKKCKRASGLAGEFEKDVWRELPAVGGRRFAWVWPEEPEGLYKPQEWHYELHFTLPKGSYATVLLEMLANRPLAPNASDINESF